MAGYAVGDALPGPPLPEDLQEVAAAPKWMGVLAGARGLLRVVRPGGAHAYLVAPPDRSGRRRVEAFFARVGRWPEGLGEPIRREVAHTEDGHALWPTTIPGYFVVLSPRDREPSNVMPFFVAGPNNIVDAAVLPALRPSAPPVDVAQFEHVMAKARAERWPLARVLPVIEEAVALASKASTGPDPSFVNKHVEALLADLGATWQRDAQARPFAELVDLRGRLLATGGRRVRTLRDGSTQEFFVADDLRVLAERMSASWAEARRRAGAPLAAYRAIAKLLPKQLEGRHLSAVTALDLLPQVHLASGKTGDEGSFANTLADRIGRGAGADGIVDIHRPTTTGAEPVPGGRHRFTVAIEEENGIESRLLGEERRSVQQDNPDWLAWERARQDREQTLAYMTASSERARQEALYAIEQEIERTAAHTHLERRSQRLVTVTRYLNQRGDEMRRSTDVDSQPYTVEVVDYAMRARHEAALARRAQLLALDTMPNLPPLPPEPQRKKLVEQTIQRWSQKGTLRWHVTFPGASQDVLDFELALSPQQAEAAGKNAGLWELRNAFLARIAARARALILDEARPRLAQHLASLPDAVTRADEADAALALLGLR